MIKCKIHFFFSSPFVFAQSFYKVLQISSSKVWFTVLLRQKVVNWAVPYVSRTNQNEFKEESVWGTDSSCKDPNHACKNFFFMGGGGWRKFLWTTDIKVTFTAHFYLPRLVCQDLWTYDIHSELESGKACQIIYLWCCFSRKTSVFQRVLVIKFKEILLRQ